LPPLPDVWKCPVLRCGYRWPLDRTEHHDPASPVFAPQAPDNVNHPPHYTAGSVECIDAIRAALTPEEFRGYCKGNVLKYTWRERHKGGDESLAKAQWYLKQLTETKS